jgi:hypothetical protein
MQYVPVVFYSSVIVFLSIPTSVCTSTVQYIKTTRTKNYCGKYLYLDRTKNDEMQKKKPGIPEQVQVLYSTRTS